MRCIIGVYPVNDEGTEVLPWSVSLCGVLMGIDKEDVEM